MEPNVGPALEKLAHAKPWIIDEADGWLDAFKEAAALGYRGTSHKNCKGVYKSLKNLAFAKRTMPPPDGTSCFYRRRICQTCRWSHCRPISPPWRCSASTMSSVMATITSADLII